MFVVYGGGIVHEESFDCGVGAILAGLMEKPQLLKLPIVRDGRRATVGYCPEIWEAWLKG